MNTYPSTTYAELFDKVKPALPGNAAVMAKRQEALDYFIMQGFPKASREEWRYTRLGTFLTSPIATSEKTVLTPEMLKAFTIEGLDCYRMVFVDGWFDAALSDRDLPEITNIATMPEILETVNGQDEMEALNIAFMTDGVILRVPKNTELSKPLYVLFISTRDAGYPRNRIVLEEGSKAILIESYVTINNPLPVGEKDSSNVFLQNIGKESGEGKTVSYGENKALTPPFSHRERELSLTNAATEITVKENAILTHYKHQQESADALHIATTRVTLEKNSGYVSYVFTVGGKLSRNTIQVDMKGERASSKLYGIYLGKDNQHLDHYMPVYHHAPNCFSEQRYKGVLDDRAKGVFYGKVFVPQDAQKTDAHQSNHNLLLSETAVAYSRPELEIHANDVKCSHGSATGAVDKDAMFYLRSRGIEETEARALLVEGFVQELLSEIPQPSIKHYWQGALKQWLGTKP